MREYPIISTEEFRVRRLPLISKRTFSIDKISPERNINNQFITKDNFYFTTFVQQYNAILYFIESEQAIIV